MKYTVSFTVSHKRIPGKLYLNYIGVSCTILKYLALLLPYSKMSIITLPKMALQLFALMGLVELRLSRGR